jgi:hypothetical protein
MSVSLIKFALSSLAENNHRIIKQISADRLSKIPLKSSIMSENQTSSNLTTTPPMHNIPSANARDLFCNDPMTGNQRASLQFQNILPNPTSDNIPVIPDKLIPKDGLKEIGGIIVNSMNCNPSTSHSISNNPSVRSNEINSMSSQDIQMTDERLKEIARFYSEMIDKKKTKTSLTPKMNCRDPFDKAKWEDVIWFDAKLERQRQVVVRFRARFEKNPNDANNQKYKDVRRRFKLARNRARKEAEMSLIWNVKKKPNIQYDIYEAVKSQQHPGTSHNPTRELNHSKSQQYADTYHNPTVPVNHLRSQEYTDSYHNLTMPVNHLNTETYHSPSFQEYGEKYQAHELSALSYDKTVENSETKSSKPAPRYDSGRLVVTILIGIP